MRASAPAGRFIPLCRRDVIAACADDERLASQADFRDVCEVIVAILHFEHHAQLEELKEAFAPFDPDADTRTLEQWSDTERDEHQQRLVAALRRVLVAANFTEVPASEIGRSFDEESLLSIRLSVDLSDFAEVAFFQRGEEVRTEVVRRLLGLSRREVTFRNYARVAVHLKFKDAAYFAGKGRTELPFEPGSTLIKLFRDVPRRDLEMLFPNAEVRMRPVDKALIGVPAVISGAVVIATKLVASLGLIALLIGFWVGISDEEVAVDQTELVALGLSLGAVGAYLVRQFNKFRTRKIRFMKTLTEHLYFKNLDNGPGVFHHLVDAAEEEEAKEVVLAYAALLGAGKALTAGEVDSDVEALLGRHGAADGDFEVADALEKLARLGLATRDDGLYRALDPAEAKAHLDATWDGYFRWR